MTQIANLEEKTDQTWVFSSQHASIDQRSHFAAAVLGKHWYGVRTFSKYKLTTMKSNGTTSTTR